MARTMNCPLCGKVLRKIDKDDCSMHKIACCGKWIWYDSLTEEYKIKKIPERQSSSGVRFY